MSYNNNQEKPLPSVEYTLKNISWHLKVISESLTKLVELQGGQAQSNNPPKQEFPF
jgi:hypothetical protein